MATEWVTRNRIGSEPIETVPESNRLKPSWNRTEPRNLETDRKNRLNRTKEPQAGSPRPLVPRTASKPGTKLDRFTRPNGPLEPKPEPGGSPGPTVRNRNWAVHPAQRFFGTGQKLAVGDFLYKFSTLSIIFIHNSSLLLLSLLNYAIILLIT